MAQFTMQSLNSRPQVVPSLSLRARILPALKETVLWFRLGLGFWAQGSGFQALDPKPSPLDPGDPGVLCWGKLQNRGHLQAQGHKGILSGADDLGFTTFLPYHSASPLNSHKKNQCCAFNARPLFCLESQNASPSTCQGFSRSVANPDSYECS